MVRGSESTKRNGVYIYMVLLEGVFKIYLESAQSLYLSNFAFLVLGFIRLLEFFVIKCASYRGMYMGCKP